MGPYNLYIGPMLRCLNRVVVSLCLLAFCGLFFATEIHATEVRLDSVMHLFVQDYVEPKNSDAGPAFVAEVMHSAVQQEYIESEALRNAMNMALVDGRLDDYQKIVYEIEAFEKTSKYIHGILNREKILVKYFSKDFGFLSDIDSLQQTNIGWGYQGTNSVLFNVLESRIATGELEKSLKEIEDASDRAFINILLHAYVESKEKVSLLIEKYKNQLTKKEQLNYLVRKFWTKTDYDLDYYHVLSLGALTSTFLGEMSDTTGIGFGGLFAFDLIRRNFFFEWSFIFQSNSIKGSDSLWLDDFDFDFNWGWTFLKKKQAHLYGFLTAGLGYSDLACLGDSDGMRTCPDSPQQFYPIYGAGVVLDIFFTDVCKDHMGLRFRGGVKNIWADKVVKSSGFRLYASIELSVLDYKKKNFVFEYPGDRTK